VYLFSALPCVSARTSSEPYRPIQTSPNFCILCLYAVLATCIIYHGLSWYNLRQLCERKFTTTARGILHLLNLIPRVERVTVFDVGADFVTVNEPADTALVLCQKLRLCRPIHVQSLDVTILLCTLICSFLPRELCSRGICHGRVSVRLCLCLSVCYMSVFY